MSVRFADHVQRAGISRQCGVLSAEARAHVMQAWCAHAQSTKGHVVDATKILASALVASIANSGLGR